MEEAWDEVHGSRMDDRRGSCFWGGHTKIWGRTSPSTRRCRYSDYAWGCAILRALEKVSFFSNKFTCALTHVHHKALSFGRKMLVYENQAPTIRRWFLNQALQLLRPVHNLRLMTRNHHLSTCPRLHLKPIPGQQPTALRVAQETRKCGGRLPKV